MMQKNEANKNCVLFNSGENVKCHQRRGRINLRTYAHTYVRAKMKMGTGTINGYRQRSDQKWGEGRSSTSDPYQKPWFLDVLHLANVCIRLAKSKY